MPLLLALLLAAQPAEPPAATRARVVLVPLGAFPADLLEAAEAELRARAEVEVVRGEALPLPPEAYYPPRQRYRAEKLLRALEARLAGQPPGSRVLGLATVDISTTKGPYADWGVFGLGDLGGPSAVISSFRLRRKVKGRGQLRARVASVAVHEVGHTLGLDHCSEAGCVMRDAEGSITSVDEGDSFGLACRARLDQLAPVRR